jgi:hypothetical protein
MAACSNSLLDMPDEVVVDVVVEARRYFGGVIITF